MSDAHCIFAPTGRIDASNAASIESDLLHRLTESGPSLVLDLSGVNYVSSAGLRVILVAAKKVRADGGKAIIAGAQPAVTEVLKMSGFDRIIPLEDSVEAAIAQIAA